MYQDYSQLPKDLVIACDMIMKAFPDGIPEESYFPILALLYDYFSDRNLADIAATLTNRHSGVAYNDVLRSVTSDLPSKQDIESVRDLLLSFGFEEWEKNINTPDK